MKLPVYLYGHPVLRDECRDIDPAQYGDLKEFVANMFDTMYGSDGVGLAAPQVGRNDRIIVIDADPLAENFPDCKGRKYVLVNPRMEVLQGETVSRGEGCLSLPGINEEVKRVEHIRLSWLDENLVAHEEEITGFVARIVQHEMDHLEGTLYVDRLSPIRKQLIRNKLHNIIDGRTRTEYPARYAPKKRKAVIS